MRALPLTTLSAQCASSMPSARTADHALVRPPHGSRMVMRALPPHQRVREKAPAGSACSTAAAGLSPLLPCRTQALEDDEGDHGPQADGDAAPPIGWSLLEVEVLAVQPQTVRAPAPRAGAPS